MSGASGTSGLAAMQRALADALRAATPIAGEQAASDLADGLAQGSARLTPAMQLDIYREQFFLRHRDVLREDFASLERLLGQDAFDALGSAYLQAFPPSSFTLRDLGKELPRFVREREPWSRDGLLSDLARVEWAFVEAFDAADVAALDAADVAAIAEDAWPSKRILFAPSVQRLALAHAAHDLRLAVRSGDAPPGALARPAPAPCWVLVFRGPASLQCLEVEASSFALLDALANGSPLGEACERVALSSGDTEAAFEEKVGAWFQQWTALGLVRGIE